ncbi:MAG: acylphosphatase [Nanoarchaeota archaeon]|nr:acylphosphatase [Nanoarchaeota archaeon]
MKRFHIFVSGRVQGVFFRANTVEVARKLGIVGWVRNLRDGRVEIVAEGSEEKLKEFVEWLKKGPILAKVVDIVIEEETPTGEFSDFEKRETI